MRDGVGVQLPAYADRLDGHLAVEVDVAGEVDHAHGPFADLAGDFVASVEQNGRASHVRCARIRRLTHCRRRIEA